MKFVKKVVFDGKKLLLDDEEFSFYLSADAAVETTYPRPNVPGLLMLPVLLDPECTIEWSNPPRS